MRGVCTARRWLGYALLWLCGTVHAQQQVPDEHDAAVVPPSSATPADDNDGTSSTDMGSADKPVTEIDRGVASWYGGQFHGRPTASGEPFDMHALTAAHPTLPFGTIVRVRSLVNDRVVDVRINDRGPFSGGRIIDLSRAAAAVLGLIQSGAGTKHVQLNLLQVSRKVTPHPRRIVSQRRSSGSTSR